MTKRIALTIVLLLIAASPSFAQRDTGGLPQQVQWGMEHAMRDLEEKSLGITVESMEESVGKEALQDFIDGAVIRLILSPEGQYTSYALEGGDLMSFTLGKKEFAIGSEWESEDDWIKTTGEFSVPKKPQKLALKVSAQGQEISVECYNKYGQTESDVTYYIGPLNGLFCMGLSDTNTLVE